MRVCSRRISFELEEENKYNIIYKINTKLGFSYSYDSFSFEKILQISGKINKTTNYLELPLEKDLLIPIFKIKFLTKNTFFTTIEDINGNELDYSLSTIFKINELFNKNKGGGNDDNNLQSIAEGNEAISLFGLDIDFNYYNSENLINIEYPERSCYLILKFNGNDVKEANHCNKFYTKENVINKIELRTALRDLSYNLNESNKQRFAKVHRNKICKLPTDTENKMRDWNSVNLSICYTPKFVNEIKNIQKSNYAKECYENRNGKPEKHGIEFRISATRIGFGKADKTSTYWIVFDVGVIIGFSFSKQTIEFSKTIKAYGEIYKSGFYGLMDDDVLLFSIQLGSNGLNFGILTDEINDYVYNYGSTILAKFEHQSIQELINEEGAIAMIGPDINMEGNLLSTTDFEIISTSEKACDSDLRLNNETMKKQFSCYVRPSTQCDELGLDEYKKLRNAYENLLELYKKCPCRRPPRPSSIPEDRLIIPPISRKKRDINDNIGFEERDYDRRIPECENTTSFFNGDVGLYYEEVMEWTEEQSKCCKENVNNNKQKRRKRQIINDNRKMSILWPMPIYYEYAAHTKDDLIDLVEEGLFLLSDITCLEFERISKDSNKYKNVHKILFKFENDGCFSKYAGRPDNTLVNVINMQIGGCTDIGTVVHEVMHALGFLHEQSRSDREESVWIYYDNIYEDWHSQFRIFNTTNFGSLYDFGSVMHYPVSNFYINKDMSKFIIVALKHQYQNTMGQREGPSFKDIKIINRLYYPLNNCRCRCPGGLYGDDGYGDDGAYCTEFYYSGCRTNILIADVTKQSIYIESEGEECFFVIQAKKLTKSDIKPKRMLINIESVNGLKCDHPCSNNYIKIKFLEDKTAEGARICCNYKIMPLTISAEVNTDVLIMRKGSIGNATISYQLELTPHSSSSSCKDVQESTYDKDFTTSGGRLKISVGGRLVNAPPNYGPRACTNVNGKYFIRNDCVEDSNPDPWCYYGLCFYCMKVEGFDEPKWFWYSPDGEWILVTHSGYVMNQGKN